MDTIDLSDPIGVTPGPGCRCLEPIVSLAEDRYSAALLAMAGHDLRQPLQVIAEAHDVLGRTLDGDEQHEELARAENATAQLTGVLGQLFEALYRQRRPHDRRLVPVKLRPILENLAEEFDNSARLRGVTFLIETSEGSVFSHPVLLSGVLRNLIRDAIDHTPPGGGVFVATRRRGPELCITVRDSSAGAPVTGSRATVDTFRSSSSSLGVFIVRHVAELLGHRVTSQATMERGSRVTVAAYAV